MKVTKTMATQLKKLGFDKLATGLDNHLQLKRKLIKAYDLYQYINQKKVDDMNEALKKEGKNGNYLTLAFINIGNYDKVPPQSVLTALAKAKATRIFDSFEICFITEVKDPILFGRIKDCPDRFFIAQWDDDISLTALLIGDSKSVKLSK